MKWEKLRLSLGILSLVAVCQLTSAQIDQSMGRARMEHNPRLSEFPVIEFRRYTIKDEQRSHFTQHFDTYFPEAFQQLGTIAALSLL
jgi:hypothetical protein